MALKTFDGFSIYGSRFNNEEYPFRPDIDYTERFSFEGKTFYYGDDLPGECIQTVDSIEEYWFHDEKELPPDVRKAVKKGKSRAQVEVAISLKKVYHSRPHETYPSIAKNARIPSRRGSGFVGEEAVKKLINRSRYMSAAQATALCSYLGCTFDEVRFPYKDPIQTSQKAQDTLSYIEKALQLHDLVMGDDYLDRLMEASNTLFQFFQHESQGIPEEVVDSVWNTFDLIGRLIHVARN